MITHITVIFRKCDARIYRSFTGSNRHIRCICDKYGPVGKSLSRSRVNELGEFFKNLRHFVSALAAADINDDISIAPFCKLVLCHSFARAEAARYSSRAALCYRENGIDNTLTRDKRLIYRQTVSKRTRLLDRPFLAERKLDLRAIFLFKLCYNVIYSVVTVFSDPSDLAL